MLALHALSRPFDYSGRAPRAELWAILLITILVVGLIAAAEIWVTAGVMVQPKLAFVALGLLLPSLIAAQVRRLHDCGHSGRWLWLTLVPIASLALHAYLLVAPARKGYRQRDHAPLASILVLLAIVLATGLVISRAFWQPFWIPSGSMK